MAEFVEQFATIGTRIRPVEPIRILGCVVETVEKPVAAMNKTKIAIDF